MHVSHAVFRMGCNIRPLRQNERSHEGGFGRGLGHSLPRRKLDVLISNLPATFADFLKSPHCSSAYTLHTSTHTRRRSDRIPPSKTFGIRSMFLTSQTLAETPKQPLESGDRFLVS